MKLQLGLSPCPNDTYIFHALLHGLVRPESGDSIDFEPVFADVQALNRAALAGSLPVTKVSAGVLPHIIEKYAVLASGGAMGWGCGPLVVARSEDIDPARALVAIPGRHTAANRLLDLHGGFAGARMEMVFSEIMPAVASGAADIGVIIHEGRFTYQKQGLSRLLDLGEWWENQYGLPLPLGAIVVRRDIAAALGRPLEAAIAASIHYANANPQASREFVRAHAQELDEEVTRAHISTFVTEFSIDPGELGKAALSCFLDGIPGTSIFLTTSPRCACR